VNGHTTGQFHLNPDDRPQHRRFRLDTVSLRGLFNQQIHGSKRSLRSVEDFTEFEFRTAYFNGDPIHAMKNGFTIIPRVQVAHMAQMQNMFDFPPAPKLNALGRLDPTKATESERRREELFFGKAQCATCHDRPAVVPEIAKRLANPPTSDARDRIGHVPQACHLCRQRFAHRECQSVMSCFVEGHGTESFPCSIVTVPATSPLAPLRESFGVCKSDKGA
jgi:hypothetical protein